MSYTVEISYLWSDNYTPATYTTSSQSLKEIEEYFGSFEINRRILFRNNAESEPACQNGDCEGIATPAVDTSKKMPVASPCTSSSCYNFVNRLNNFGQKA